MRLVLKKVRLAFPVIYKPEAFQGEGDPAFSAAFLLPKNHPSVPEIEKIMVQVASEKWGAQAAAVLKQLKAQDRAALHDGDLKAFDGYAGNLYVNSRSSAEKKPLVIKRDKSAATPGSPGSPYSGCFVDTQLDFYAQDNQFGKRINATLLIVQFREDGPAFSGGATADVDEMDDLSTSDDLS